MKNQIPSKTFKHLGALLLSSLILVACSKSDKGGEAAPQDPQATSDQMPEVDPEQAGGKVRSRNGQGHVDGPKRVSHQNPGIDPSDVEITGGRSSGSRPALPSNRNSGGHPRGSLDIRRDHYMDPQIFTGAGLDQNHYYTDAKNDSVMFYLVNRMRTQRPDYLQDSRELAMRVKGLDVQLLGEDHVSVELSFQDAGKLVEATFVGRLQGRRAADLFQEKNPKDYGYNFNVSISCIDRDQSTCQNRIIRVDQIEKGVACKTIYLVSRIGNSHFIMSDGEYNSFYSRNGIALKNMSQFLFMEYLANTVLFNKRYIHNQPLNDVERLNPNPMPRARFLKLETWAAAYGTAEFRVHFQSETTLQSKERLDQLSFRGPLVSQKNSWDLNLRIDHNAYSYSSTSKMSDLIRTAYLTGNDGRGNLGLRLQYVGQPKAESQLEIMTLLKDVVDIRNLKL